MKFCSTKVEPICKECGGEFKSIRGLGAHVSRSHMPLAEYYHKHHPRRDLHTTNLLSYDSSTGYLKKFFESALNERKWVEDHPDDALDWYKYKLEAHAKERKYNKYCDSWVEWVSLRNVPFDEVDGLVRLIGELGLEKRFDYMTPECGPPVEETQILVDSREKQPLFNKTKTKINAGDYTLEGSFYNGIHIDRKSLPDFIGTFTTGYDRFVREMEKATACGAYMVVLVEEDFWNCLNFRPKRYGQKTNGSFAFVGVRKLMQAFKNVQFLFVPDRDEAARMTKLLLGNPDVARNYDLQYTYNNGLA